MTTLIVSNLPFETSERDLGDLFDKYGKIGDIYLPMDFKKKGFAFVRYLFVNRKSIVNN